MNLFKKYRNKEQSHFNELIKRIDKKHIDYVVEKIVETQGEKILGKNGGINISNDEIVITCEGKYIFRGDIKTLKMGELMNLSGLMIKGFDKISQSEKSLIAYYSYYRK